MTLTNREFILGGERVALAKMTEEDQPAFQKWLSEQAELRALIDDPRIPTMEDQMKWFERSKKEDRNLFSLVTIPEGVLIGNGGLVDIDPEKGAAQFRITIGNQEFRGQGLGKEATNLILQYAFGVLELKEVHLRVLKSNERAKVLYEKVGFVSQGEYDPEPGREAGFLMSLTRDQFSL